MPHFCFSLVFSELKYYRTASIESSKVWFAADQTPTPTRFIRNCEEVGLFQDLQNVNPFEETFRKAVESGKTGSSALQVIYLLEWK